jgi:hypothetical protein
MRLSTQNPFFLRIFKLVMARLLCESSNCKRARIILMEIQ